MAGSKAPMFRRGVGEKTNAGFGNRRFSLPDDGHSGYEERGPSLGGKILHRAERFRFFLSNQFCGCIASIPSLAFVIITAVLLLLLIISIPLAFAMTYRNSALIAEDLTIVPVLVNRFHDIWPNSTTNLTDQPLSLASIIPPNVTTCRGFGFSCTTEPGFVIGSNQRCDGHKDCQDGSDEFGCTLCQTTFSCALDIKNPKRKLCLRGANLCDGHRRCVDGSDEALCNRKCNSDEFKCKGKAICLPKEMLCDGDANCPHREDEKDCTECNNEAILCPQLKRCIPRWKVCDGKKDCPDGRDEMDCDCTSCSGQTKSLCKGEKTFCIEKAQICDGRADCPNGEDEQDCPGTCTRKNRDNAKASSENESSTLDSSSIGSKQMDDLVMCKNGEFHSWYYACGGLLPHCQSQCKTCNLEMSFQCGTQQKRSNSSIFADNIEAEEEGVKECITKDLVCDGKNDCDDGSDESDCTCEPLNGRTLCEISTVDQHRFIRHCFSDSQRCDGYKDCPLGEDERGCKRCKGASFLCKSNNQCVPMTARCDGRTHCPDNSDEENCTCEECLVHPFSMYKCSDVDRCFRLAEVCSPQTLCPKPTKRERFFCALHTTKALHLI